MLLQTAQIQMSISFIRESVLQTREREAENDGGRERYREKIV